MADTDAQNSDVIEVRSDERFDEQKLATYLSEYIEGANHPLAVQQFGGGHANLTYLLRYGEADDAVEYVLRRPPLGPVAKSAHDMHREYRALSVLWQEFPYAPRALHYCGDESVIGAEFLVMERRAGVVVRGQIPERFGGGRDPVANRKLSEIVIDVLAEFHEVDPVKIGLDSLGKPEGFLARQVKGWSGRYDKARSSDNPVPLEVARWLEDNLPVSPTPTLLHNDWRLDNMAVSPDDPGQCVAVYDWDMCTVGDPLCDLGTVLCAWTEPGEMAASAGTMPTGDQGFMPRAEAIQRYCQRRGIEQERVPYYQVFGTYKMGVVLQQIYIRYQRGQTHDKRFSGMEAGATALFERAAALRP